MNDQESTDRPVKRCLFCGSELPPELMGPTSRRVWVIVTLTLYGVAIAAFIAHFCIGGRPLMFLGLGNGIVIATTVLNGVFSSYIRRRQMDLGRRLLAMQRETEESTEVKKGT